MNDRNEVHPKKKKLSFSEKQQQLQSRSEDQAVNRYSLFNKRSDTPSPRVTASDDDLRGVIVNSPPRPKFP